MRSHCCLLRAANLVDAIHHVSTCRARIPRLDTGDWGLGIGHWGLIILLRSPAPPAPPALLPQSPIPSPFFN